ncbi:MAG: LuxR C-terminal-related transcriptional regulator [Acidobacteriota bacterium]
MGKTKANLRPDEPALLWTKLNVPQSGNRMVTRTRLNSKLGQTLKYPVTLVAAPAGYGKTTAVAEWLRHSSVSSAWISLDTDDNDLVRFWRYVLTALNNMLPGVADRAWTGLASTFSPPIQSLLTLLIDDMSQLQDDHFLILDDYHLIEHADIHESIAFFIQNMPTSLHVVLTSRTEPPLALPRLRARGQLMEVLTDDLRFREKEVKLFYQQRNIDLDKEQVKSMGARTEGWAAGLQLALLSIRNAKDLNHFIDKMNGDNRHIAGYLADEVFDKWTQPTREFFMFTSILDRFTPPLCDSITGRQDSRKVLDNMVNTNAFVVSLDQERRWYRYHHLFADFLQNMLRETYSDDIPSLHRNAAEWFRKNNYAYEAIEHLLKSRDYVIAAELIAEQAPMMVAHREITTLTGWLKELPDADVVTNPMLCLAGAWAFLLNNDIDNAEEWVGKTQKAASHTDGEPDDDVKQILGELSLVMAQIMIHKKDHRLAIALCSQARENISLKSRFLKESIEFNRGEVSLLYGVLGFFGNLTGMAQAHFENDVYQTLKSMGEKPSGYLAIVRAELLYELNETDGALRFLMQGLSEAEQSGRMGSYIPGIWTLIRIHTMRGQLDGTFNILENAKNVAKKANAPYWMDLLEAIRMRSLIQQGNLDEVEQWVIKNRLNTRVSSMAGKEFEYITLARFFLAKGVHDENQLLLGHLLANAYKESRIPSIIEILNLMALNYQAQGEMDRALGTLARSISTGIEYGYLRRFADEGAPMFSLLSHFTHWNRKRNSNAVSPQFVRKLFRLTREVLAESRSSKPHARARSQQGDILTNREIEVLRLLAEELTGAEICERLGVKLPTVKTHTGNIISKLGVKNRAQAVQRAKELGIF